MLLLACLVFFLSKAKSLHRLVLLFKLTEESTYEMLFYGSLVKKTGAQIQFHPTSSSSSSSSKSNFG